MRPVKAEALIPAPRDVVFRFVADSRNDAAWCPLVSEVTGPEPGPGAEFLFLQKGPRGRVKEARIRTVDWHPPDRIEWVVEDPWRRHRIRMEFEARGQAT